MSLFGVWFDKEVAKKWPDGIIVVIHRTDRGQDEVHFLQVEKCFRKDWIDNVGGYGTGPMEFMRLT